SPKFSNSAVIYPSIARLCVRLGRKRIGKRRESLERHPPWPGLTSCKACLNASFEYARHGHPRPQQLLVEQVLIEQGSFLHDPVPYSWKPPAEPSHALRKRRR